MMPSPTHASPVVLIVDDEQRLREMLMRNTTEVGYRAVGARSAEQAIRILDSEPVDIMLLDLNLPGIDGMRLLEQMQSRQPKPQVRIGGRPK